MPAIGTWHDCCTARGRGPLEHAPSDEPNATLSVPRATYRIQFTPDFGFKAAAALAPYLADLGVSHLYASPYLQAAPGSRHGYDVVDHTRVNEELGGEEGHRHLVATLARHGLGQILDVVPNHMAISSPGNALWWDVLENGRASLYAHFFDVDWDPPLAKLENTILLPILEDHYGRVLEAGLLRLRLGQSRVTVRYREYVLPVAPRTLPDLLSPAAEAAGSEELAFLSRAFAGLPEDDDPERRQARHQDLLVLKEQLRRTLRSDAAAAAALEAVVRRTEAHPDALHALLDGQSYRLSYWRTGTQELDYRRFFDIDSLAALRAEDEEVFQHSHARVLAWLEEGVLDGVRVDHPDGLRRPKEYLDRLRHAAPEAWVVVEKILAPGESLPETWPVQGTTGYDFLNDVGGLFVDPRGEEPLTSLYAEVTGEERPWGEVVVARKREVLRGPLAADLDRLTHLFVKVCEGHRRYRDYTRRDLREALTAFVSHLPVYRTYVGEQGPAEPRDREVLARTTEAVRRDHPEVDHDLLDFLRRILVAEPEVNGPLEAELRMRLQQHTGAVTAKAVEDTAFYGWVRLAALNEVGGDPDRFALAPEEIHRLALERQRRWPYAMLALSTHDTKRGEDVRARLFTLSEIPDAWSATVRRWMGHNDRHRRGELPDRNAEYLLYQTLVGAHPLPVERALAYMEKASREAKDHTSWTDPDRAYEAALAGFVEDVLADPVFQDELARFVAGVADAGWVNALGQKLVQLTAPGVPDLYQGSELWDLTLVDPDNRRPVDFASRMRLLDELGAGPDAQAEPSGVPAGDGGRPRVADVGEALGPTEGGVPPRMLEGRRAEGAPAGTLRSAVATPPSSNWRSRGSTAERLAPSAERLWARRSEGLPKLWVVRQALALRTERPEVFGADSDYEALEARGPGAEHVFGFARGGHALSIVPRLPIRLREAGGWRGTTVELPEGRWRNRLTGEAWSGGPVPLAQLLARFPVALLARET